LAVREREGLTFRELARRSGICAGTLGHWAWRLRRERADGRKRERGFVELVAETTMPAASSSRVEIVLRDERRVIVDSGIEVEALARVLAAVARC
jgi:hypothetical protein